uniref:Uncharacterized protein n=1 Tax=Romanomermis culicivorax TaxID=13658 RepID=A0A915INY4_ROMCU
MAISTSVWRNQNRRPNTEGLPKNTHPSFGHILRDFFAADLGVVALQFDQSQSIHEADAVQTQNGFGRDKKVIALIWAINTENELPFVVDVVATGHIDVEQSVEYGCKPRHGCDNIRTFQAKVAVQRLREENGHEPIGAYDETCEH